jgi:hypothetical protein
LCPSTICNHKNRSQRYSDEQEDKVNPSKEHKNGAMNAWKNTCTHKRGRKISTVTGANRELK